MRPTVGIATLITSLLIAPEVSPQARATLVPAMTVSTVHDDNLFSGTRGVGDYLTHFQPSIEGTYESPTVYLESLASFDAQLSARHSALNAVDSRRHAMFDGRVRTTPRFTLGMAARYDRTETPGELNLETAVLGDRQRAQRIQLTPSIAVRPTLRTNVTFRYDWTNEKLAADPSTTDMHTARVNFARTWPRTAFSLGYLGRMFVDRFAEHRSQAALVGISRDLAPGVNFSLHAGPRMTTYRGMTAEVLAALIRRTPRTKALLDYWHGETIILGILGPVEVHSGTAKLTRVVRRDLEIGAAVGLFRSQTLERAEARVLHGSIVGAWSFADPSYGADFQRGDIRSRGLFDERVRRGVFRVSLTVAPRLSRAFRPREDSDEPSTPITGVLR
jgi:hypothetical protein